MLYFYVLFQVGKLLMENAQLALHSDSMKSRAVAIQARSAVFSSCGFPENSITFAPSPCNSLAIISQFIWNEITFPQHTVIHTVYVMND